MTKKIIVTSLLALSLGGLLMSTAFQPVEARYGNGSTNRLESVQVEAVSATELKNLDEMFTILIKDEYNARATYTALVEKFGDESLFAQLINAESRHIRALTRLFSAYELNVPIEDKNQTVVVPDTLLEAYKIGEQAEINNIKLYENFLSKDLPTNVERVFIKLMNASEKHFETFIAYEEGNPIKVCGPIQNTQYRRNKRNN